MFQAITSKNVLFFSVNFGQNMKLNDTYRLWENHKISSDRLTSALIRPLCIEAVAVVRTVTQLGATLINIYETDQNKMRTQRLYSWYAVFDDFQPVTQCSAFSTYTGVIVERPTCSTFLTLVIFWAPTLAAGTRAAVHLNSQQTTQPGSLQQVHGTRPHTHQSHLVHKIRLLIPSKISQPCFFVKCCLQVGSMITVGNRLKHASALGQVQNID